MRERWWNGLLKLQKWLTSTSAWLASSTSVKIPNWGARTRTREEEGLARDPDDRQGGASSKTFENGRRRGGGGGDFAAIHFVTVSDGDGIASDRQRISPRDLAFERVVDILPVEGGKVARFSSKSTVKGGERPSPPRDAPCAAQRQQGKTRPTRSLSRNFSRFSLTGSKLLFVTLRRAKHRIRTWSHWFLVRRLPPSFRRVGRGRSRRLNLHRQNAT